MVCDEGARCRVDATEAASGRFRCDRGSVCIVDCRGGNDCGVQCRRGARCFLGCGDATRCGFSQCNGGERTCPGGIVTCNAACPDV